MQDNRVVKVGDVVAAWNKVPSGSMVLSRGQYLIRRGDRGCLVGDPTRNYWTRFGCWSDGTQIGDGNGSASWERCGLGAGDEATIIDLNVPADATADDLRTLAEVFEVREAILALVRPGFAQRARPSFAPASPLASHILRSGEDAIAERLHAAGWHPGMTAEDAARLLSESA